MKMKVTWYAVKSSLITRQKAVVKIGVDPSHTYYWSLFLEEQTGDSWTCESLSLLFFPALSRV